MEVCSTKKDFVGRVFEACNIAGCSKPMILHYIIHQHALCGKDMEVPVIMEPVVSIVNFIRFHGLNHRQFREFILEIEAEYPDIPYHTQVRLLSCGIVLLRFFEH
ncbi:hypothetical protein ANN_23801 [Periplaneta americana]|uniref:Uncharacterized protein n=1 Tax=Periplaneta americana TaxID=6978 RepID=A0ABQ8SM34_PERAM|nr:hypothetical protein ANN_23801 [Periplaneta americana]